MTGYQSYAQVIDIYGQQLAETLLSNHRAAVALAVGRLGESTIERLSKALGEHEIKRERSGRSQRWGQMGTRSQNEDIKPERVVLPSEIAALDNLHGYLSYPGSLPVAKFKLEPVNYRRAQPVQGIVPRERTFA